VAQAGRNQRGAGFRSGDMGGDTQPKLLRSSVGAGLDRRRPPSVTSRAGLAWFPWNGRGRVAVNEGIDGSRRVVGNAVRSAGGGFAPSHRLSATTKSNSTGSTCAHRDKPIGIRFCDTHRALPTAARLRHLACSSSAARSAFIISFATHARTHRAGWHSPRARAGPQLHDGYLVAKDPRHDLPDFPLDAVAQQPARATSFIVRAISSISATRE
jgi:hypothetical protein